MYTMQIYTQIVTGTILIALLYLITSLGKKQMEPMTIQMPPETNALLDLPTHLKLKTTTYQNMKRKTLIPHSFDQITNNEKTTNPDNGSILLPELSGFYN